MSCDRIEKTFSDNKKNILCSVLILQEQCDHPKNLLFDVDVWGSKADSGISRLGLLWYTRSIFVLHFVSHMHGIYDFHVKSCGPFTGLLSQLNACLSSRIMVFCLCQPWHIMVFSLCQPWYPPTYHGVYLCQPWHSLVFIVFFVQKVRPASYWANTW